MKLYLDISDPILATAYICMWANSTQNEKKKVCIYIYFFFITWSLKGVR